MKISTVEEIKALVTPVARSYGVERAMLFGSYAPGTARPESDIDIRVDGGEIRGLFRLAGFERELEELFSVPIDVLTTGSLDDEFLERIKDEEIVIYEIQPQSWYSQKND